MSGREPWWVEEELCRPSRGCIWMIIAVVLFWAAMFFFAYAAYLHFKP